MQGPPAAKAERYAPAEDAARTAALAKLQQTIAAKDAEAKKAAELVAAADWIEAQA